MLFLLMQQPSDPSEATIACFDGDYAIIFPMKAARALRYARQVAGLSQRDLARATGIPQSTIGRIEAGLVDPRVGTLSRLLRACRFDLEVEPRLGIGVDRSQIRANLQLTPAERIERAGREAGVFALRGAARRPRRAG